MTAPDVLYASADGRMYDATARAWDARTLRPLVSETAPAPPLAHKAGCLLEPWLDLAPYCTCTSSRRYVRRRVNQ